MKRKSSLHNLVFRLRQYTGTGLDNSTPSLQRTLPSPARPKSSLAPPPPPPPSRPTIVDDLLRYEQEGFFIPKVWHGNKSVVITNVAVVGDNEVEFSMYVVVHGGGTGGVKFDVSVQLVPNQPWSLTSCVVACSDFSQLEPKFVDEEQGVVRLDMMHEKPGWLPHYSIAVLVFLLLRTLPVTAGDLKLQSPELQPWLPHRELRLNTGCASVQGRRMSMEDHLLLQPPWQQIQLFGVFDGHGGANVALQLSQKLPLLFDTFMIDFERECREVAIGRALKCSLDTFDRELVHNTLEPSGSTACVVAVDLKTNCLQVANVGDSRCVLSRQGQALDLSVDHKANHPFEVARILTRGGFVSRARAMGVLAVSRAVGDRDLKRTSHAPVVCDADVDSVALNPNTDEFLLIACDGLFDVMSSQQAVTFIRNRLAEGVHPNQVCELLAAEAINELQSMDNVSIVLITFAFAFVAAPPPSQSYDAVSTPLKSSGSNSVLRAARASALKRASSQKKLPVHPQPEFVARVVEF
ncbi:hypothetical protein BASA81_005141 [Batrachochytrium salamandrivorans]|nr:hypothetical protein BASA81_005141 [Batrachochytrium salamandrivorans]